MAKLDQLPTEVLLLIINLVRSNRDFLAFSRTSRSIHNLTNKELPLRRKYRRIRIKENSDFDKAFALLLSILRRPQLGDYVRHIEFDRPPGTYADYDIKNKDLKELSDEDSQRLRTAVNNTGFTGEYAEKVINMVLQPDNFRPEYAGLVRAFPRFVEITGQRTISNGTLELPRRVCGLAGSPRHSRRC